MKDQLGVKFETTKEEFNKLYQIGMRDTYSGRNKYNRQRIINILSFMVRHTDVNKFNTILDVGCGEGILTGMLASMLRNTICTVIGIDISDVAIEMARDNFDDFDNIVFETKDICDVKQPNKLNLIILSEILYYLPEEKFEDVVKNIVSLLAKDGYVLICNCEKHLGEVFHRAFSKYLEFVSCETYEGKYNIILFKKAGR